MFSLGLKPVKGCTRSLITPLLRHQRASTANAFESVEEDMVNFEQESNVMSYGRSFPRMFSKSSGALMFSEQGEQFIDFFSGAGSLNYGHNNPRLKKKLIEYIELDGVSQGLDMFTTAKKNFIDTFNELILKPRGMDDYVLQFTGPTGTNAVEAALKLSRKVTGKENIVAFTNAYHGVTLGALATTGNEFNRGGAGVRLGGVTRMPYCGFLKDSGELGEARYLSEMIKAKSTGIDAPAGMILECVQGEGGLNVATDEWLVAVSELCADLQVPLIVDEVQTGCGRTGTFFSFEKSGIRPDIIALSKSISGYGTPMSLLLVKRELDVWQPAEHNGTFRGNNQAFVTASEALRHYWSDDALEREVLRKSEFMQRALQALVMSNRSVLSRTKGKGMMTGVECIRPEDSRKIVETCFESGLILETCGPYGEVVKCFPPLTIEDELLFSGLETLKKAVES